MAPASGRIPAELAQKCDPDECAVRVSILKNLALCLLPALATAQETGLWEISSRKMLEQMNNLPPEQRQMMEQVLAQQGVQLSGQGVRRR